jgi:hypothetical protein
LSKEKGLTQECFEQLLNFLGPNPEEAAQRYEAIRKRLIQIFNYRSCSAPEELADRTFDRVCEKIGEIAPDYQGDPALYFYGVANWIYLETFRHRALEPRVAVPDPDIEVKHLCLEECLALLTHEDREMVLEYYRGEGRKLIANRKKLAERLGISIESLRRKVFKLRHHQLDKCIASCLEREGAA